MIRQWLQGCTGQHELCRSTISGTIFDENHQPSLPTRVLGISDNGVRLVYSHGAAGAYAALSHCWGPKDRRPLSTTIATLNGYMVEIPWARLPKSFQDAVKVTRKVGLKWLWIDSLCIVQDDDEDWRRESLRMGTIYENAEITLASSHSKDSHQGFLLPRGDEPSPVELPIFLPDGYDKNVKVMATLRYESVEDIFPEHGILNERAWATQEWLLSRRILFFTPGALVWSCKEITQRETGERCYSTSRNMTWTVIVERYSDRKLTFAKDRLIALEGLRTKLGEKTGFNYAVGIWKEGLPNQLLWQVTKHQEPSDVLGLPSWSWMHVPCGVRFLLVHSAKSLITNVVVSDSPTQLSLRSWAKRATAVKARPMLETVEVAAALQDDMERSNIKCTSSMAHFLKAKNNHLLGWVVLDTPETSEQTDLTLVALMGGLQRRDEQTERQTGRVISKKLRRYWVLALERQTGGTYIRIGVGKTYGRDWWQDAGLETVNIV